MNDIIVGIGEVLWDVFPEGKGLAGLLLILLIICRNSVLIAGW